MMFHYLAQLLSHFCQFPIRHQQKENQAEGETAKIKVDQTKLSVQMTHLVLKKTYGCTLYIRIPER